MSDRQALANWMEECELLVQMLSQHDEVIAARYAEALSSLTTFADADVRTVIFIMRNFADGIKTELISYWGVQK